MYFIFFPHRAETEKVQYLSVCARTSEVHRVLSSAMETDSRQARAQGGSQAGESIPVPSQCMPCCTYAVVCELTVYTHVLHSCTLLPRP